MTVVTLEEAKSRIEELAGLAVQGEAVRIEERSRLFPTRIHSTVCSSRQP
jgi:hypothetical protein